MDSQITIDIVIGILSAILGLSYPFFLQIIQQIDIKYGSILLVRKFHKECVYKVYNIFLILAVISLFCLPFVADTNSSNFIICHSVLLLSLSLCGLAVGSLALLTRLINKYNDPLRLLARIVKHKKDGSLIENREVFNQFNDILKYSIKEGNVELYCACTNLLANCTSYVVSKCKVGEKIVYPAYYYESINDISQLCFNSSQFHPSVSHPENFITALFLHSKDSYVSDNSFRVIWYNVIRMIDNGHSQWVKNYWAYANSASLYFYRNSNDSKRTEENYIFILLHNMIAAYVQEKRDNALMDIILKYSRSTSEPHPLIPDSLNSIVDILVWLGNKKRETFLFVEKLFYSNSSNYGISSGDYILHTLMTFYFFILLKSENLTFYYDSNWEKCQEQKNVIKLLSKFESSDLEIFSKFKEEDIKTLKDKLNEIYQIGDQKLEEFIENSKVSPEDTQKFKNRVVEDICKKSEYFPRTVKEPTNVEIKKAYLKNVYNVRNADFLTVTNWENDFKIFISSNIICGLADEYLSVLNNISPLKEYNVETQDMLKALDLLKPTTGYNVISFGPMNIKEHVHFNEEYDFSGAIETSLFIFRKEKSMPMINSNFDGNLSIKIDTGYNPDMSRISYTYSSTIYIPRNFSFIKINLINSVFDGKISNIQTIQPVDILFGSKEKNKA